MKRTKLLQRKLPDYTRGEEIMNMVTHIVGAGFGIIVLVLCLYRSIAGGNTVAIIGASIYGAMMIFLYAISSIYHGLHLGTGKKVMQILDHCAIYFLITGTYTPILLSGFLPRYPAIAWGLLILQWGLGILAATLTAIDLKKYNVLSMVCYIIMGWAILPFIKQTAEVMSAQGFYLLLMGGILYTLGAILYGIGSKLRWIHSVFHIFVVAGSVLQFLSIYLYIL